MRRKKGPLARPFFDSWWSGGGSNSRPSHCERDALPAERPPHEGPQYTGRGAGMPSARPRPGATPAAFPRAFSRAARAARCTGPMADAHLVQLLLPLRDNAGRPFPRARFDAVRSLLVERFGGATAYVRSPAVGEWEDADGDRARDDVVLFEVVVDALDAAWWADFRRTLEREFAQESLLVRALAVRRL